MAKKIYGWKAALRKELEPFLHVPKGRSEKRTVSDATMRKRSDVLFLAFAQLREGGYKLENPHNLKQKHVEFLMTRWVSEDLSPSTITNRLSIVRIFCEHLGKLYLVQDAESYVDDPSLVKRVKVAQTDKSWDTAGIDTLSLADTIEIIDPHVAAQLRLMFAFGLRIRESVCLKPFESDRETYLLVCRGSKGGRHRFIPIDSELKRSVLDAAKKLVKIPTRNMCRPGKQVHQELNRFYTVMKSFGITGGEAGITPHGLRHQYLQTRYTEITGHEPPVRGGIILDKAKEAEARMSTMIEAGHGRIDVGASYYGAIRRKKV
jgi:site-specific recombinase XerC